MISGPPEFTAMNISPRPACPSHRPRAGRATGDPDAVLGPLFRCGNGISGTACPGIGTASPGTGRRRVVLERVVWFHQVVHQPPRVAGDVRVAPRSGPVTRYRSVASAAP